MAQTKKRTSARTGNKRASSSNKNTRNAAPENRDDIRNTILFLVLAAACTLLFLSNAGLCGTFGDLISAFLFGMFGIVAYAMPFLLFFGIIYFAVNKNYSLIVIKAIGAAGLFAFAVAFAHILFYGFESGVPVTDFYFECMADRLGGGLLGGLIVQFLGSIVGIVGAYLIIIVAMVIFAVLMTQRSFLADVQKSVRRRAEARARAYEEAAAEEEAEEDDGPAPAEPVAVRKTRRPAKKEQAAQKEERKRKRPGREQGFVPFDDTEGLIAEEPEPVPEPQSWELQPDIPSGYDDFAGKPVFDPVSRSYINTEPVKNAPEVPPAADSSTAAASSKPDAGLKKEAEAKIPNLENDQKSAPKRRVSVQISSEGTEEAAIAKEIKAASPKRTAVYRVPPLSALKKGKGSVQGAGADEKRTAAVLRQTLHDFGIDVTVTDVSRGPSVTRYEIQPAQGVPVSRITNHSDDLKLHLAASDIRIEAPIPGKAAIGIEVPNKSNTAVMLRDMLETDEFRSHKSKIAFAVGMDIGGKPIVADIAKMPHVLIAGATGSGKSVCINTLIMSILYKSTPGEVRFIMIDPKMVELSVYNGIPHLLIPVVTDPKKAAGALNWAVQEMTDRYNKFADAGVRDLESYNDRIAHLDGVPDEEKPERMPQIVLIVDELADLMMVSPGEVEDAICRLAQLARAAGIHLVIATQRPSVNVVTGLIKANMPSRIALAVASGVDSRTILDMNGAEKLLGHGDMLFYPQGYPKPVRVQGAYVSDEEIHTWVKFFKDTGTGVTYDPEIQSKIDKSSGASESSGSGAGEKDEYFIDAAKLIVDKEKASIGMLQRAFKIGFNRAARIVDQLCDAGVVGPEEGTKPRQVLMTSEELENRLEEGSL